MWKTLCFSHLTSTLATIAKEPILIAAFPMCGCACEGATAPEAGRSSAARSSGRGSYSPVTIRGPLPHCSQSRKKLHRAASSGGTPTISLLRQCWHSSSRGMAGISEATTEPCSRHNASWPRLVTMMVPSSFPSSQIPGTASKFLERPVPATGWTSSCT